MKPNIFISRLATQLSIEDKGRQSSPKRTSPSARK